jgi:D-sedoheptulose 7-phosphate isomerase
MANLQDALLARIKAVSNALEEPGVADQVEALIQAIVKAYETGNKLMAFGNGGNAASAEQLVTELIARYCYDRDPIPAILLTAAGPFTAINNDYGYGQGFARQVEGLSLPGDIVVGYSSSGNSENVLEAIRAAKVKGAITVGFSGSGGELNQIVDIPISVQSTFIPVIEEAHLILIHLICGEVEERLFSTSGVQIRTPDY